jgi:rare lipoprotein A
MNFYVKYSSLSAFRLSFLAATLVLSACSSNSNYDDANMDPNAGRYAQDKDSIPLRLPTAEEIRDAEPTVEPLSRGGNKPYNIYGVDYSPRTDIMEYSEIGTASWYGNKFHGHKTSNGETYNVFAMTAAHKTLPLPSYVRVTNLDNNSSAIVRVNDRGPFHQGRIIDLSYAAAYKLGVFPGGTGRVKVELVASPAMVNQTTLATGASSDSEFQEQTLSADQHQSEQFVEEPYTPEPAIATIPTKTAAVSRPTSQPALVDNSPSRQGCFIQLIASSDEAKVQKLGNEIRQQLSVSTKVEAVNGLFRLIAGPFNASDASSALQQLRDGQYPGAYFTNKNLCS